jgi:hypothetical protein
MRDALRRVIATHLDWLSNLRWVSTLEYWLTVCCGGGIVVTTVSAVWVSGQAASLSIPAAHLMLMVATLAVASRKLAWPLLATLCLSLLNYMLLLWVGSSLVARIALGYLWLGCAAGLVAALYSPAMARRWAAIGSYTSQDDFKWLLTTAPLWLRWRFMDEVETVKAAQPRAPQA